MHNSNKTCHPTAVAGPTALVSWDIYQASATKFNSSTGPESSNNWQLLDFNKGQDQNGSPSDGHQGPLLLTWHNFIVHITSITKHGI